MNNSVAVQKPKFSVALQQDAYKKLISNTLQDPKRVNRFVSSISSAVATNPALQECDAGTILSCALLGESLELSPSPQLGQYYLVPFKQAIKDGNGKKIGDKMVATFILGYKGYIQLAIRSGQYKKLNVVAIKRGELVKFDPLTEEIEINLIADERDREAVETVGYYAMFEYMNGFKKAMYWSKEKMEIHALQYSKAYANDKNRGWSNSFWTKDFDGMAYKTLLRQLISKWGVMSIDMRTAFESDDAVVNTDGTTKQVDFVENETLANNHEQIKDNNVELPENVSMDDF